MEGSTSADITLSVDSRFAGNLCRAEKFERYIVSDDEYRCFRLLDLNTNADNAVNNDTTPRIAAMRSHGSPISCRRCAMETSVLTHSSAPSTSASWNARATQGFRTNSKTGATRERTDSAILSALEKCAAINKALSITGISRTKFTDRYP